MTTEEMREVVGAINTDSTKLLRLLTIYENAAALELSPVQMHKLRNKATRLKQDIISKLDSLPF